MKITHTIAMASALLLAAGCAHEEHHAQYDESISPYASDGAPRYQPYGGSYSPGGSTTGTSASQPASRSDDTIVTQVRESLQQDPEIAPIVPNIQITANNGTVELNGTVQSQEQKRQIQSIVVNTGGVVIVDDHLHVSSTGQSGMGQTSRPNEQSTIYSGGTNNVQNPSSNPQLNPNTAPSGQSGEGGTLNPTSTSNNSPPQIYQNSSNSVSAPGTLNPTSNDTNSAPRLYQEPGNTTSNSSGDVLNPTSRTNGTSEIYEKNNQGKSMEQQNTNNNNPMP